MTHEPRAGRQSCVVDFRGRVDVRHAGRRTCPASLRRSRWPASTLPARGFARLPHERRASFDRPARSWRPARSPGPRIAWRVSRCGQGTSAACPYGHSFLKRHSRADAPRTFIVVAAHHVRFHQHSRLQPCGDARGDRPRASPIILRRTPPRKPGRWFIHQVSRPAATSRRSPSGVGARHHIAILATITLEMPVQPDPHAPPAALRDSIRRGCCRRQTPASSGCARRLRSGRDSPTPSARHRRRPSSSQRPKRISSHADDDVLADRCFPATRRPYPS